MPSRIEVLLAPGAKPPETISVGGVTYPVNEDGSFTIANKHHNHLSEQGFAFKWLSSEVEPGTEEESALATLIEEADTWLGPNVTIRLDGQDPETLSVSGATYYVNDDRSFTLPEYHRDLLEIPHVLLSRTLPTDPGRGIMAGAPDDIVIVYRTAEPVTDSTAETAETSSGEGEPAPDAETPPVTETAAQRRLREAGQKMPGM